jgi:hypothetical protein
MLDTILQFISDLLVDGNSLISFVVGGLTVAVSITVKRKNKTTSLLKIIGSKIKSLLTKKKRRA